MSVEAQVLTPMRQCPDCGEYVNPAGHGGRAWQVHRMQHSLEAQTSCPCGWTGKARSLGRHRVTHTNDAQKAPPTVVATIPVIAPTGGRTAPAQPASEESLAEIVDALLSVTERLDVYARSVQAREERVHAAVRALQGLLPT